MSAPHEMNPPPVVEDDAERDDDQRFSVCPTCGARDHSARPGPRGEVARECAAVLSRSLVLRLQTKGPADG